jgi:hypothetical protein
MVYRVPWIIESGALWLEVMRAVVGIRCVVSEVDVVNVPSAMAEATAVRAAMSHACS